jgi:hypothetical protein
LFLFSNFTFFQRFKTLNFFRRRDKLSCNEEDVVAYYKGFNVVQHHAGLVK